MKVLVAAASRHGSTTEIAEAIGEVLAERGFETSVKDAAEVLGINGYDAVVLGSAVYMGKWTKPARDLVKRCSRGLASHPVWIFSSGPVGDPLVPADRSVDVREVQSATRARDHHVFAGRIDTSRLTFTEKGVAAALKIRDGDYRDFEEVRAWARCIADSLATEAQGVVKVTGTE